MLRLSKTIREIPPKPSEPDPRRLYPERPGVSGEIRCSSGLIWADWSGTKCFFLGREGNSLISDWAEITNSSSGEGDSSFPIMEKKLSTHDDCPFIQVGEYLKIIVAHKFQVSHLHMHIISPESELSTRMDLTFRPDSYWFKTTDTLLAMLDKLKPPVTQTQSPMDDLRWDRETSVACFNCIWGPRRRLRRCHLIRA